jgi:hypothetical protein
MLVATVVPMLPWSWFPTPGAEAQGPFAVVSVGEGMKGK